MRFLIVAVVAPLWVALAWLIYFGGRWLAAFVAPSQLDQIVLATIAVIVVMGVCLAAMIEKDWTS